MDTITCTCMYMYSACYTRSIHKVKLVHNYVYSLLQINVCFVLSTIINFRVESNNSC